MQQSHGLYAIAKVLVLVLPTSYSQDSCTDFTINTSNDVVSRKDVPFGGLENQILYVDPILPPPKAEILGQFLMGQKFAARKGLNNGDAHL